MSRSGASIRDDTSKNPNALHDFHKARRGPKNVPHMVVMSKCDQNGLPKDPGHPYSKTTNIRFDFHDQRTSNAPFGYEHFISLPPGYEQDKGKRWPLILFLHGAGESQQGKNESFAFLRHGIPKVILCYDQIRSNPSEKSPRISIPLAPRLGQNRQIKQGDKSVDPVPPDVCSLVAENFITVSPSLNMGWGYGWNASILSALLDEIVERYQVDLDRIHVTGFSMGGYGTWELALHSPNRFASLMPICGGGDRLRASHIKHVPQWVHHGDLDDVIPVRASEQMVETLTNLGAVDVKFTRYPDLMHDSWTAAYNNPDVYSWMLRQTRGYHGNEWVVPAENKVSLPSPSPSS